MSFSKDINKFVSESKNKMQKIAAEKEDQAKAKLIDVMKDDLSEIKAITFDLSLGLFRDVEAPEYIKEKLRQENLLFE